MKTLLLTLSIVSFFSVTSLKAQKQAQQDDNKYVMVVRTEKAVGKGGKEIHYTLTNNNSVSMDFSLYTQLNSGSWNVTHHLDLAPGQTYEDVSGFSGVNGKYVVYSAPHSDWASFPSFLDISKLQAANTTAPAATPTTTTTPTTATTTTSAKSSGKTPAQSTPSPTNSPSSNNTPPPVPPPM